MADGVKRPNILMLEFQIAAVTSGRIDKCETGIRNLCIGAEHGLVIVTDLEIQQDHGQKCAVRTSPGHHGKGQFWRLKNKPVV
jgi:hypothetical protein